MKASKKIAISISILVGVLIQPVIIYGQDLDSTSYTIKDPSFIGTSGVSDSGTTNYSLISSIGDTVADARLESGSYAIGSGFPNGIQASVPLIRCLESDTDDTGGGSPNTECLAYPLTAGIGGDDAIVGDGMQGICGTPGCYDRAKIEIDAQSNPIDTLYLVAITDTGTSTDYYLQSDNTIDTAYDINDYQTICQIEGYDPRTGSGCVDSGDPDWDETLQEFNIIGLTPGATYSVRVRALNGDFTESPYSPAENVTMEYSALSFDIDIADNGGSATDTEGPHSIELGLLQTFATTATNRIWVDIGTNFFQGATVFVSNSGLTNGSFTIPSTDEDLDVDAGMDGGYGLKIETFTEGALGPLLADATFNTGNPNEVGGMSGTPAEILYTDSVTGQGPVSSGRSSIMVKSRIVTSTPPGAYTDTITFTMIANP